MTTHQNRRLSDDRRSRTKSPCMKIIIFFCPKCGDNFIIFALWYYFVKQRVSPIGYTSFLFALDHTWDHRAWGPSRAIYLQQWPLAKYSKTQRTAMRPQRTAMRSHAIKVHDRNTQTKSYIDDLQNLYTKNP